MARKGTSVARNHDHDLYGEVSHWQMRHEPSRRPSCYSRTPLPPPTTPSALMQWPPHSFLSPQSFLPLLLLLLTSYANGAITNTTFDDASNSFTFVGQWTAITPSSPCGGCASKPPDLTQIYDGTWHDGNYMTGDSQMTSGSFTFTGSAVYIYGIDQTNSQPNIVFTLGSIQSTHHYTGTERFAYNALFFSATDLPADQTQTVNWIFETDPSTGEDLQEALFDYAIVTSGTDDTTTTGSTSGSGEGSGGGSSDSSSANANSGLNEAVSVITPTKTPTPTNNPSSASPSPAPNVSRFQSIRNSICEKIDQQRSKSLSFEDRRRRTNQSNFRYIKVSSSIETPCSPVLMVGGGSTSGSSSSPGSSGGSASSSNAGSTTVANAKSKPNAGAIAGALVALLVFGVLGTILFCVWRRRRRQRAHAASAAEGAPPRIRRIRGNYVVQPFVDDPPPASEAAGASPSAMGGSVSEKTLDVEWNNAGMSTVSLLGSGRGEGTDVSRPAHQDDDDDDESGSGVSPTVASSRPPPPPTPTPRERMLEERLAQLEAQVAGALPPPPYMTE
ncbi:hypothetical protein B0H11DRAFT_2231520 [Mycena galericulata]|nr:hypothetical protein B0H11DRAFT_2231520 [Mycena galericulata]